MDDLRREKIRLVLGMNKCVAESWLMGWNWPMSQETLLKSRYGSASPNTPRCRVLTFPLCSMNSAALSTDPWSASTNDGARHRKQHRNKRVEGCMVLTFMWVMSLTTLKRLILVVKCSAQFVISDLIHVF